MDPTCICGHIIMSTGYGTLVCPRCGIEDFSCIYESENAISPYYSMPATYTRLKRFRRYLERAARQQSITSVPPDTWAYLYAGMPYSSPGAIVNRLKAASNVKKCYDSLPILVRHLCPDISVPSLKESDKNTAMFAFQKIETSYAYGEPFVSYVYALEYILKYIGRSDMLPFINKIKCRSRRAQYRQRLDSIFKTSKKITDYFLVSSNVSNNTITCSSGD